MKLVTESRQQILNIEDKIKQMPGHLEGDCFLLKHSFAGGMYVREIIIPKNTMLVSKIHKFEHPVFVMEGDISILADGVIKRIKAPCSLISPAGAKRVGFAHENTRWITVHKTNETDLEKIEEEIIAKSFDELSQEEVKFIDVFSEVIE